jgi:ribonucleoside-diphosphate reductase alpha chain
MSNEYRWLTDLSRQFLERDYLVDGQSVEERVDIICDTAERILKKPGFANKFKENLKKGWYSLSSPIWSNFGTARGLPISCFGSYICDSMESILYTHAEVGMMTKHGGGTSAYFGNLRGRGESIRQNGQSSGSVHFMSMFENLINVVSQGTTRRGNFAAYLPIDHKDIVEFIGIRNEGHMIQDLSFGVCVSDAWMQSMVDGDKDKRVIWAKVLESRANKGYPYIFFTDNVNNNKPDCYKNLPITHSNLCITGDQLVVTSTGMKRVYDLFKTQAFLTLFDGEKSVSASPMKLIEKSVDVYEIITEAGRSHKVTGYHKVKTDKGMIECNSLSPGVKICVQQKKGLFGSNHAPEKAFLFGLYQGDGTQTDENVFIDLWENDFDLKSEIEACVKTVYKQNNWLNYKVNVPNRGEYERSTTIPTFFDQLPSEGGVKKLRLQSAKLKQDGFQKGHIPDWIWAADEVTQWQYLRGLLFTDGTVELGNSKGNPIQVSITSTNFEWLQEIQILMSNLGLKPSIHLSGEEGRQLLPDGHGGRKQYLCKAKYRLIISNKPDAITVEKATGFLSRKNVQLEDRIYRDNTKKFDTVKEVKYVGKEDVYCTTVQSDEHMWVCNSFVTSNCTEIFLPDSEDESFVCDLSSMNILYFDEWKDTDAVELLTYFLDAVMTEFIEKGKKVEFMSRPVRFAERHRALGIGWLGYHSYLQSKMIPFESMEAKYANVTIAKNIKEAAYKASAKLAQEYGEPEVLKGYGRRNSTLLAIAPTKSSAFIMGQVSENTEPNRTNIVIKDLQKGKYTMKNTYLESLLETKGKNDEVTWSNILKNGGSVQHLDFLTKYEKDVFKTFGEITPREIIIQAAQRQKYIDQGQSLNIMIHPSIPIKDVNALIIEGWQMKIKSFYYQYSINAAQNFARNILACASCEA